MERELARAQGARRLLPWALLSALGGGAIAWVAGGGPRGGAALAAVGLLFVLFLWATSIARCPACGASLPKGRIRGAGATGAGVRPESCPACGARF
jgi:hypothetical protein